MRPISLASPVQGIRRRHICRASLRPENRTPISLVRTSHVAAILPLHKVIVPFGFGSILKPWQQSFYSASTGRRQISSACSSASQLVGNTCVPPTRPQFLRLLRFFPPTRSPLPQTISFSSGFVLLSGTKETEVPFSIEGRPYLYACGVATR